MIYKADNNMRDMIKDVMKRNAVSQEKLARMLNVNHQKVHRMLHKTALKFKDIAHICNVLGYDLVIDIVPKSKDDINSYHVYESIQEMLEIVRRLDKRR